MGISHVRRTGRGAPLRARAMTLAKTSLAVLTRVTRLPFLGGISAAGGAPERAAGAYRTRLDAPVFETVPSRCTAL